MIAGPRIDWLQRACLAIMLAGAEMGLCMSSNSSAGSSYHEDINKYRAFDKPHWKLLHCLPWDPSYQSSSTDAEQPAPPMYSLAWL